MGKFMKKYFLILLLFISLISCKNFFYGIGHNFGNVKDVNYYLEGIPSYQVNTNDRYCAFFVGLTTNYDNEEISKQTAFSFLKKSIFAFKFLPLNCVVDTDALTKTHRTEFLDWFPSFEHHMVYIAAEKWLRYSNNDFRRRHVPEEEMKRMERRLEVPRQNEDPRWMSITVIENVENEKYVVRGSH